MSNVLEFYLKMKDMMSSGLVKVAQTAKQSFASVSNSSKKFADSFDNVTSKVNKTRDAIGKLRSEASKPLSGGGGGGGRGWLKGLIAAGGLSFSAATAFGFVKDSINTSSQFGATSKSFEVLTGSKSKGQGLANSLNQLQQDTILGPEVFKSAQTLLSFGVAADKVVKIERQLGDVSMGNKEHFDALTLAFAQTQAAGKLMGQDLLQYINAGFNPLQVMSEHWKEFGYKQSVSVGQLKQLMEHGKISAGAVAKAFELSTSEGGRFNNMMDTISQTTYGKLQILAGQWENFKLSVGNSLDGVTNKMLSFASATLSLLNPTKTASQEVQEQTEKIYGLYSKLTSLNTTEAERHKLLQELNEINPNITKGISEQSIQYGKLSDNIQSVVNALGQKRVAEMIQQSGSDTLNSYGKAVESRSRAAEEMTVSMSKAAAMYPYIAVNNQLTNGQKQQAYINALQRSIAGGTVQKYSYKIAGSSFGGGLDGSTIDGSVEGDLLAGLKGTIKQYNDQNLKVGKLLPAYYGIKNSIKGAMDSYNSLFGVVTPTKATGNAIRGSNSSTPVGTSADSVGKSLTSGGPRVINISGVQMKAADKIEIKVITNSGSNISQEFITALEPHINDMWMRVLSSGASVQ